MARGASSQGWIAPSGPRAAPSVAHVPLVAQVSIATPGPAADRRAYPVGHVGALEMSTLPPPRKNMRITLVLPQKGQRSRRWEEG